MVTTTLVPALATKSMAPPIPFTILPYNNRQKMDRLIRVGHMTLLGYSAALRLVSPTESTIDTALFHRIITPSQKKRPNKLQRTGNVKEGQLQRTAVGDSGN